MVANLLRITYKITKRFFVIIEKKEKEGDISPFAPPKPNKRPEQMEPLRKIIHHPQKFEKQFSWMAHYFLRLNMSCPRFKI